MLMERPHFGNESDNHRILVNIIMMHNQLCFFLTLWKLDQNSDQLKFKLLTSIWDEVTELAHHRPQTCVVGGNLSHFEPPMPECVWPLQCASLLRGWSRAFWTKENSNLAETRCESFPRRRILTKHSMLFNSQEQDRNAVPMKELLRHIAKYSSDQDPSKDPRW